MHNKTVLLFTLGKTPQIITETLWAIYQDKAISQDQKPAWPDEIKIITNQQCAEIAKNALLPGGDTEEGKLAELYKDLGIQNGPTLTDESFLLISDKTDFDKFIEAENEIEDFIMSKVKDLTNDSSVAIHANYTGGIKSMSTILCRAMDFYGRPFDLLSCIFVTPDFQQCKDFYYPKKQNITLHRGTEKERKVNAIDAKIMLRKTAPLPQKYINPSKSSSLDFGRFSYYDLIKYIEISKSPDLINLDFYCNKEAPYLLLSYNKQEIKKISFKNRISNFSFFLLISKFYKEGKPEYYIRCPRIKEIIYSREIYNELVKVITNMLRIAEKDIPDHIKDKTLESTGFYGINKSNFNTYRTQIKEYIENFMPSYMTTLIVPNQNLKSKKQGSGYIINIPKENISFHYE